MSHSQQSRMIDSVLIFVATLTMFIAALRSAIIWVIEHSFLSTKKA
jgi:hypothetical protein